MSITPRVLRVVPSIIIFPASRGVVEEPNYSQKVEEKTFVFAYRKTKGPDKRVRIVYCETSFFGAQSVHMYYLDTEPRTQVVPVIPSNLSIKQNRAMSIKLMKWWTKEFAAGNTAFNEGQTYTLNRYSFDILSTEELDAIADSTLYVDQKDFSDFSDNFKY
jgi:hypothetical protein